MKNATPHILEALEDEMMRLSACGRDAPKKGHGTKDKARAHCKLKDSKL
jgi:hypothetical protein